MAQQAQAQSLNSDPLPETELLKIPRHAVNEAWIFAEPLLEEACERSQGRWSLESIKHRLEIGQDGLILIGNETITSAVVVTVAVYPNRKILSVQLAGGKLEDMKNHLRELDEIADEAGCDMIEIHGRKGWKILDGFTEVGTILGRDLNG